MFPGRDKDQLGFSVAKAHNGDKYKQSMSNTGTAVTDAEVVYELTYRARINRWLAVQPDIQYVRHPGTNPTLKDALVIGMRLVFTPMAE